MPNLSSTSNTALIRRYHIFNVNKCVRSTVLLQHFHRTINGIQQILMLVNSTHADMITGRSIVQYIQHWQNVLIIGYQCDANFDFFACENEMPCTEEILSIVLIWKAQADYLHLLATSICLNTANVAKTMSTFPVFRAFFIGRMSWGITGSTCDEEAMEL